jgi:phosphoribosylformylglycinamidine synthase
MLWEIEVQAKTGDPEFRRVAHEYSLLTHEPAENAGITSTARGYLLEGNLSADQAEKLLHDLILDPVVERGRIRELTEENSSSEGDAHALTVLPRPGVMDPAAFSVRDASHDLGIDLDSVRTFRRYYFQESSPRPPLIRVLANDLIEQVIQGPLALHHLRLSKPYRFQIQSVALRGLDDTGLERLSKDHQLALNLVEMQAIRHHFRDLGREPTDIELETIAQTWSEHCSHKTLKGKVDYDGRRIDNLLKQTIFAATQQIRSKLGPDDWCVSVFEDNAGIVRFDERNHVCFKVETHNHPSALEPYGGANTGLGGVIRDALGTGLAARPVCNTDVFCFAAPDTAPEDVPPGVLHPRLIMKGVVAGVRDYGNRMGIPTVNGAVCFDPRYIANPLVFCGTVGLLPVDRTTKKPMVGDLIVVVGGRTGRDGIHGATFSSAELTAQSDQISGGAVQIGNAIAEKKMLDVIIQARDRGLYHAITDCGAGGFSSAVGEMAEMLGAVVHLDRVPLKYQGLSYSEIWISESQERMVLAVPPTSWPALQTLCESENVEAAAIGSFEASGRLHLLYQQQQVCDLDMQFLHHGRPNIVRQASIWRAPDRKENVPQRKTAVPIAERPASFFTDVLLKILSSYNVCSKEWIIRQYDHEVQGGSVIKPLVGVDNDGPSDASVIMPVLGSELGLAIGCGINPRYGDRDPYRMAASAIDEAVRNVVAVGADPRRIALLDNFCWGNTDRPEQLGALVRAAEACHDVALAYGTPFISGKDSLNNEYRESGVHLTIPATLLISALGRVPDVCRCVSMDLKDPGNVLFLIGMTREEMGGSHYHWVLRSEDGEAPSVDLEMAPRIFDRLHQAIQRGLVRSCHDLSEGGLAVAVAEMAFAGGIGCDVLKLPLVAGQDNPEIAFFSESNTRFLVEVKPDCVPALEECLGTGISWARIGITCKEPRLRIAGASGEWLVWAKLADLKEAWQKPLRW